MPNFRCHFLDERDKLIFPADVKAKDLEAAKHLLFDILSAEDTVRSSTVRSLEIWQDNRRVYPEPDSASPVRIA